MYEDLTKKQIEILEYIKSRIKTVGYPPSVREICKGVNLKSTSTVHGHMNTIEEKGYIRRDATKPRAIEVLDLYNNDEVQIIEKKETVDVPILGDVAAGIPMLATENIQDTYPVPSEIIGNKEVFMLKVHGESMIEKGILSGDLVLVEKRSTAINGEIVVALIDNEATIKTFYKESKYVRLQPENSSMEPIYTRNVTILGVVKALYRTF